jgi:hypothetical protein
MANSDISPTLIKLMAFQNVIASWKDLIAYAQRRIDSQCEIAKAAGIDVGPAIAILEAEITIYRTAIDNMEARRKELLGVPDLPQA